MEFLGRKVLASLEEGAQDRVALGGLLKANPLQVLVKDPLRLAHHFARDGGLIIDTFLQHQAVWGELNRGAHRGAEAGRTQDTIRHIEIEIHVQLELSTSVI